MQAICQIGPGSVTGEVVFERVDNSQKVVYKYDVDNCINGANMGYFMGVQWTYLGKITANTEDPLKNFKNPKIEVGYAASLGIGCLVGFANYFVKIKDSHTNKHSFQGTYSYIIGVDGLAMHDSLFGGFGGKLKKVAD